MELDQKPIVWEYVGFIHLAEDRDQWRGSCPYGNEPSGSIKLREFLDTSLISFPRGTLLSGVG
jgi:hypothetical protein